jgi:hypothetical protein
MFEIVVGIARPDRTDGGLDLHQHESLVIIDIVERLRSVSDAPDNVGRDLDRIAAQVVDLELFETTLLARTEIRALPSQGQGQRKPWARSVPRYRPNK